MPQRKHKSPKSLAQYVLNKPDSHGERAKAANLPTLDKVRRFTGIVCNAVRAYSIAAKRQVTATEIVDAVREVISHYEGTQNVKRNHHP